MKKLICFFCIIIFAGCQKEINFDTDSGTTATANSIAGIWKFISLEGNTQATTEYTDNDTDYKSITSSNYLTKNNTGTITFNSDSTYVGTDLSYNLSFTANGYIYKNGVLADSTSLPIQYPYDSSGGAGKYVLIGSDSIYFSEGFISSQALGTTSATPSGGKYSLSGNTLSITQTVYNKTTTGTPDKPYYATDSGKFVITLQKQ